MGWILDGVYGAAVVAASPWLIASAHRRRLLPTRMLGQGLPKRPAGPVAWFHGVSVGEVMLMETLLKAFHKAEPQVQVLFSSSTDTGLAEAQKRLASFSPFPFPFDFSFAVNRALDQIRPDLIVLAESELWPQFLEAAQKRNIPVAVINARMSPKSLKRWQWARPIASWVFPRVRVWAVQQEDHALALQQLGVKPDRIHVTGSIKFDHAVPTSQNEKVVALKSWLALDGQTPLWVAGSTQPTEEKACLEAFAELRKTNPDLRLAIVPRDPARGTEIAALSRSLGWETLQRSDPSTAKGGKAPVAIVDTIGELGALWNLATLAFVGGSLDGKRGGQNMIEPASRGLVPVFGPHTWNFQAITRSLVEAGVADRIPSARELAPTLLAQLANPEARAARGQAAKEFVARQQGATDRTIAILREFLPKTHAKSA